MCLAGLFRSTNVLTHYRAFELPKGQKFRDYLDRLLSCPAFGGTCSDEKLYHDSYER
jgi:glutathione S-transferase